MHVCSWQHCATVTDAAAATEVKDTDTATAMPEPPDDQHVHTQVNTGALRFYTPAVQCMPKAKVHHATQTAKGMKQSRAASTITILYHTNTVR
jgi:hypothetical protein